MLIFLASLTASLYLLWDLFDYQKRVKSLRKRLGLNKKVEPVRQILYAIPLVVIIMLFQLPLGIGLFCFLLILYYYDKQFQEANMIKAIEDELPQFLRLMAVAIRGGLSTNTALEEIIKRMPTGPLTNELSQVVQEMELGLSRREALENWAARIKSEQVSFLVQSWMQSEELGTEPSEVLSFLADQLYDRKLRTVEAEAMKASVKITIPLAFLIFPAVMIIIFGPIIIGGI